MACVDTVFLEELEKLERRRNMVVVKNFIEHVNIPGHVLIPGAYVFRKEVPESIFVFRASGELVGECKVIGCEREEDGSVDVVLKDQSLGAIKAVDKIFPEGEFFGYEFVY